MSAPKVIVIAVLTIITIGWVGVGMELQIRAIQGQVRATEHRIDLICEESDCR